MHHIVISTCCWSLCICICCSDQLQKISTDGTTATESTQATNSITPKESAERSGLEVMERVCLKVYDEIQAEVSEGGSEIKHSLPELKYLKKHYFPLSSNISTVELENIDRQRFQVLVLSRRAMSIPGQGFILAYLKNPDGKIVHWRSCWLSNRRGILETKLLDVNDDGLKEFCFVCKPFKRPEQVLGAYSVRDGKFDPVVAERISHFLVEFDETLSNGLLLQPQLKERYIWQTDKLYEIPIRVTNRSLSSKPVDLRRKSLRFSDFSGGSYFVKGFTTNALAPSATVETTIIVRFSQGLADQKFGFEIEELEIE